MALELKLIPDGGDKIPAEARDDSIVADHLKANADPSGATKDNSNAVDTWRDSERVVPGSRDYLLLRVPGDSSDYSGNSLDGFKNAIVNNISGLKAHPDGWQYVSQG